MSGGLRPPVLKFSFQVGDVWFCGFYLAFPLNGEFWPKGGYVRGVMSGYLSAASRQQSPLITVLVRLSTQQFNWFSTVHYVYPHSHTATIQQVQHVDQTLRFTMRRRCSTSYALASSQFVRHHAHVASPLIISTTEHLRQTWQFPSRHRLHLLNIKPLLTVSNNHILSMQFQYGTQ